MEKQEIINKNRIIYVLKGLAILSVISAHCGNRYELNSVTTVMNQLLSCFGTIGVPVFFLLSGYLFHNTKKIADILKSKFTGIVVPWIATGLLIWLYETLKKGIVYSGNPVAWLLGIGNYLWYLPVLICYFLVFYFVRSKKTAVLVLVLGLAYHIFRYDCRFAFLEIDSRYEILNNILCQLPFFSLGFLIQKTESFDKCILFFKKKKIFWTLISTIIICCALYVNKGSIYYNSQFFLIYALGFIILFLILALTISAGIENLLVQTGKVSFFIYLVHMPIAGLISNIFSRVDVLLYFVFLQPLITLGILLAFTRFIALVGRKWNLKYFYKVVGLNEKIQ